MTQGPSAHSASYGMQSFAIASSSKATFPQQDRRLPLSPWFHHSDYEYPCDDCLPVTPPASSAWPVGLDNYPPLHRSSRSRTPSCSPAVPEVQPSKFVETSGLASYRFSTGLPTPESSRPCSPSRPCFSGSQPAFFLNRDIAPDDKRQWIDCEDALDDSMLQGEDEEEEEEEEFRRKVLARRRFEFDGDMEEWDQEQSEGVSEGDGEVDEEEAWV
ncbi:hypothetical protein JCM3766R1_003096 [Sporobolomyces carnicolor]